MEQPAMQWDRIRTKLRKQPAKQWDRRMMSSRKQPAKQWDRKMMSSSQKQPAQQWTMMPQLIWSQNQSLILSQEDPAGKQDCLPT